jgi:hypothetical protein
VKNAALRLVEETARFRAAVREVLHRPTGESLSMTMKSATGLNSKSALEAHPLDSSRHRRPQNDFQLHRGTT